MAEALGKEDIKEQKWQMTLPIDTVDLGERLVTCGDEENAVFWSEEIQTIFVLPTPA